MEIITKIKQSIVVEQLPDGTYPAILYRMVHIGTLQETYRNTTKSTDKILLSFVIPSHTRQIRHQPMPITVHMEYTLSLYETSRLRKAIGQMIGWDIFKDEPDNSDFDITSLIGQVCLVNIQKKDMGSGRSFLEITHYAPLPEDELYPECPFPLQSLSYSDFDWNLFISLSNYLRAKIESTPEYKAIPETIRKAGIEKAKKMQMAMVAYDELETIDYEKEML